MKLEDRDCTPCRGGVPALPPEESSKLLQNLNQWEVVANHHLTKTFLFSDFQSGLDFVNRIGEMAEKQGHHPDILLTWGKVRVEIWTHKINGLTESDFILAAKCDTLYNV